jgi:hypothetical protein
MPAHALLVLIGLAWLAPWSSVAATAPIYKCIEANLRVVYTDTPCTNGERLDIHAGDADPAAMARLQRERDALDQSAARRIADQQRQSELAVRYMAGDYGPEYEWPAYDNGAAWWLPGIARPHQPRARGPKVQEPRRFAPTPPFVALPRH